MKDAWNKVIDAAEFFSLPDVYIKLKKILDDPTFSMAKVALVISQDPAITLRLLKIVNSAFFGLRSKVETVDRAITLLGTDQVHDLVLTTSVTEAFNGLVTEVMDMPKFWKQSIRCAVIARLLAYASKGCNGERLFVSGLLHDIGHLPMYKSIPELCLEAIHAAEENDEPVYKTERFFVGFDYANVGYTIMQNWGLPRSLWETTKFHIEPQEAEKYRLETALIHIASLLSKANIDGSGFDEGALEVNPFAWSVSGLAPEQCIGIRNDAENEVQIVSSIFC